MIKALDLVSAFRIPLAGNATGTINEQCVSIFNIDYTARKIYMTRVGRGSNMELSY